MIKKIIIKGFAWSTSEIHAILQYQKKQGMRYLLRVLFLPASIPLILAIIHYAVLRGIKSQNTIISYVYLNYSSPNLIGAFFSNYAHNISNVTHLLSNILYFEIIIIPILILNYYLFPIHSIRFSRKFFSYSCILTFILGPFVISGLSLYFGRMLNYELGVGFSGINWAFAGLLFFLIISVMFRYLKKNTICNDSLITIHAGIVVMSFVMFFPVCVILSSIKYGGTNVFAHMSGYLFGWLTFPLLAFLLEVHEKKSISITQPSIFYRAKTRIQAIMTLIFPVWKRREQLPEPVPSQTLSEEKTDRVDLLKERKDGIYGNQSPGNDLEIGSEKRIFLSGWEKRSTSNSFKSSPSDNPGTTIDKRSSFMRKPAFFRSFSRKKRPVIREFSFNIDDEMKKKHGFYRFGKDKYFFRRRKYKHSSSHISQYHTESEKEHRFFKRNRKTQPASFPADNTNNLHIVKKHGFRVSLFPCRLQSLFSLIHRFLIRIKNICSIPLWLIQNRWKKNEREKNNTKWNVSATPDRSGVKWKRFLFFPFTFKTYQKIRNASITLRSRFLDRIYRIRHKEGVFHPLKIQQKRQMPDTERDTISIHSGTDVLPDKTGNTHDLSNPSKPLPDTISLFSQLKRKIVDQIVSCSTMASSCFRRGKDKIILNRKKTYHYSGTSADKRRIFHGSFPSVQSRESTLYKKGILRRIRIRCKNAVLFPIAVIRNRIKRSGLR